MFSEEEYHDWKIRMQAHLAAQDDDMWFVITDGPMKIMKANNVEEYHDWKIRMQAHLAAQDDDMWFVITDGPMKIMKANNAIAITEGAPQWVEKRRFEYTTEDKKKSNLDNVAKDIIYKTLDKNVRPGFVFKVNREN
ncbi:hypothetical protein F511_20258 [Dorcoceras hygrometricum]|uniref:Uncharacterized protein n=1 Tax=Dorcoceras hygrometricum TaxID=472368 RepID=A0A2Z7BVX3_9LAMI|nr:hypothetical protein F511_20258 [Dorcoceras hygrometricum]